MADVSQPGGASKGGRRKTNVRIDMTPMVDLAFLLLTFFMLTTHFMKQYAIELELPLKPDKVIDQPPIKPEKVITIILGEKNRVYWYQGIDQSQIAMTDFHSDGIRKVLLEKNQQIPGLYVFIKPSAKARYQNMIDILDEITITNTRRFSIAKATSDDLRLIATAK